MKCIFKYVVFVMLGISAISCAKSIHDFSGLGSQSKVFVEFFPCGEDSSMINLYVAHSTQKLIEDPSLSSFVEDPAACVEIAVDDIPIQVRNHSKSVAYVAGKFNPGENVTIEVDLGHGCTASSQTVIPPAIKDYKIVRVGDEVVLDYFADQYPEYMGILTDYKLTKPVFGAELFSSASTNVIELIIGHVYYWKDSDAKIVENGWHQRRFKIALNSVYDKAEDVEFQYRICGLHKDMYKYMQNQQAFENNNYGKFGLIPAVFNWTNVQGGFGIVAGMSTLSTGWFHLETTE